MITHIITTPGYDFVKLTKTLVETPHKYSQIRISESEINKYPEWDNVYLANEKEIENVFETQRTNIIHAKETNPDANPSSMVPKILLILKADTNQEFKKEYIKKIFYNSRHYNIDAIFITHDILHPSFRSNVDELVISYDIDQSLLCKIYEAQCNKTWQTFGDFMCDVRKTNYLTIKKCN